MFCLKKILKETVSVISSDPPWKYDNVRFTTVSLKAYEIEINLYDFKN